MYKLPDEWQGPYSKTDNVQIKQFTNLQTVVHKHTFGNFGQPRC